MQRLNDPMHGSFTEAIEDQLPVAARTHQLIAPEHREMLRERRLADRDALVDLADAELSLGEDAEDHQTLLVGDRLEQARRRARMGTHFLGLDGLDLGHGIGTGHEATSVTPPPIASVGSAPAHTLVFCFSCH